MLSPRGEADRKPTLSNFGCFIPRPSQNQSGNAQQPSQTTFSRAMLSPRFLGPDRDRPEKKPPNAMRKALDARGGVVKERDGFEVFYGVEPKQTRSRRKTVTGEATTAVPNAITAPRKAPQVAESSGQPLAAGYVEEQRRPNNVPSLRLGSFSAPKQPEAKEATPAVAQRARRLTAPPVVSPSKPQSSMGAGFSFAAAFSALEAATAEGVAAVVDAAMGTTPTVGSIAAAQASTAPVSSQRSPRKSTPAQPAVAATATTAPSFSVAMRSPRTSASEAERLKTPRGVPVFCLSSVSQKITQPIPETAESYSLASPHNSPRSSPSGVAAGEPNPERPSASETVKQDGAPGDGLEAKEESSGNTPESTVVSRSQAATAARFAIPALSLPKPQV